MHFLLCDRDGMLEGRSGKLQSSDVVWSQPDNGKVMVVDCDCHLDEI